MVDRVWQHQMHRTEKQWTSTSVTSDREVPRVQRLIGLVYSTPPPGNLVSTLLPLTHGVSWVCTFLKQFKKTCHHHSICMLRVRNRNSSKHRSGLTGACPSKEHEWTMDGSEWGGWDISFCITLSSVGKAIVKMTKRVVLFSTFISHSLS